MNARGYLNDFDSRPTTATTTTTDSTYYEPTPIQNEIKEETVLAKLSARRNAALEIILPIIKSPSTESVASSRKSVEEKPQITITTEETTVEILEIVPPVIIQHVDSEEREVDTNIALSFSRAATRVQRKSKDGTSNGIDNFRKVNYHKTK